jgi:phosphoglycolate phosphatase
MVTNGFKAVLFDMDGTLLDTVTDIGLAANRVLSAGGFPEHPLDDYRLFVGRGAEHLVREALPVDRRDPTTVDRYLAAFLADYSDNWQQHTQLYPGINELLNLLTKFSLRLAILSNKPHDITLACARQFLSPWDFEIIWGLHDGIPRKPDPAGALKIAGLMGLPAADFLYLGDTGIDMKTATAAGMFPIGVMWGFRPKAELESSGAKLIIETPLELFDHLSI